MAISDKEVRAYTQEAEQRADAQDAVNEGAPAGEVEGVEGVGAEDPERAPADAGDDDAAEDGGDDGDPAADADGSEETVPARKEPEKPSAQGRIDSLTLAKREAEQKARQADLRGEYWRKVASGEAPTQAESAAAGMPYQAPAPPGEPPAQKAKASPEKPGAAVNAEEPRPTREAFTNTDTGDLDEDGYLDALMEWKARAQKKVDAAQAAQQAREAKLHADQQRLQAAYETQCEEAEPHYPDFKTVIEQDDVDITPQMAFAIIETGVGGHVAYRLAKNPAEATRISKLPVPSQFIEIGALAATVRAELGAEGAEQPKKDGAAEAARQNGRRVTKAPAAPSASPGGGGDGGGPRKPTPGSADAVMANRLAMLKAQGRA
jgi:hypothetical protein